MKNLGSYSGISKTIGCETGGILFEFCAALIAVCGGCGELRSNPSLASGMVDLDPVHSIGRLSDSIGL